MGRRGIPDLVDELDGLTRMIVWLKEGGRCWRCGDLASDRAHVFSRRSMFTRFDTEAEGNCHMMCRTCHDATHKDESIWQEYFKRQTEGAYDRLRKRNAVILNANRSWYEILLQEKREEYDTLKRDGAIPLSELRCSEEA